MPDPLPAGAPADVPRFDANPERLRVETTTGSRAARLWSRGRRRRLTGMVGPLDYRFRAYTILTEPASPPSATTPNMP